MEGYEVAQVALIWMWFRIFERWLRLCQVWAQFKLHKEIRFLKTAPQTKRKKESTAILFLKRSPFQLFSPTIAAIVHYLAVNSTNMGTINEVLHTHWHFAHLNGRLLLNRRLKGERELVNLSQKHWTHQVLLIGVSDTWWVIVIFIWSFTPKPWVGLWRNMS